MMIRSDITKRIYQGDTVFLAKDLKHFAIIPGRENRVVMLNYNLNRNPGFYSSSIYLERGDGFNGKE